MRSEKRQKGENQTKNPNKGYLNKKFIIFIIIICFSREEQIFKLKSELASKSQELSEMKSNLSRLDHHTRTTVEHKIGVSVSSSRLPSLN